MPQLKGKLDGYSMRVPTPDVSVVDLVAILSKAGDRQEVNAALKAAAEGELKEYWPTRKIPWCRPTCCTTPTVPSWTGS